MEQRLTLPFAKNVLSSAYKHPYYRSYHGYPHYGWDMGCDEAGHAILSPGDGTVVAAGLDGASPLGSAARLGRCVVIVYPDAELHGGGVKSLACRMFHLDSIAVKAGQTVKRGQKIGDYGRTGSGGWEDHLHIEFDTDIRYPQYAVGISGSGKIIKLGNIDSTVNPAAIFWYRQGQKKIRGCPANDGRFWWAQKDIDLPVDGEVCPTCGRAL